MIRCSLAVFAVTLVLSAQQQPPPIPDFTPPNPLFRAVFAHNAGEVKRLLESGADPNEGRFLGATALIVSLMQQNSTIARMLMEKGGDVKLADGSGSTALMWAAAYEVPDPAVVQELIQRGADVNAVSKRNETAMTWALRRGYTPTVQALKQHGASDVAMVRNAVERSIGLLEKSAPEFVKVSGCASCHNQSLPLMTAARAKAKGIRIDVQLWDKQAKTGMAMMKPLREKMLKGDEAVPDPPVSLSYLLLGAHAAGYAADETTDAMVHLISARQLPDGSFTYLASRPPMQSNPITAAALSILALQLYGTDSDARVEKASEWLRTASARTNEERAMKLLGLAWAKAGTEDLKSAASTLLAEQRQDGGWGQLPALESDAYATGQALVALHEAGQITTADDAFQRGKAFLLRTQRADGSWLVRTRSFPFQPIKDSGFPHGMDQWISAAGSSWATIALTIALPDEKHVSELF